MTMCRSDATRTGAIVAAIAALLEERRSELDAGRSYQSLTLVVKFHKSGAPAVIEYKPLVVKVL